MSSNVSSLFSGIDLSNVVTFITYGFFFVFILYGQRIQFYVAEQSVTRSLKKLSVMKDTAAKQTTDYFLTAGKAAQGAAERLTQLFEYVTIPPVSMDPNGLVGKLEHVTRTGEDRIRGEVQALIGTDDPVKLSVGSNLVEISSALNIIHKVVRHYYLSAKKTNSYITIFQLQMVLPQIMDQANALSKATDTFKLAQPIGDGVGPMLAAKLINGAPVQKIAKDTVVAKTEYNGRTLYVLKAEGPMGYVGEPHVALQRLIEDQGVSLNMIIMVDAAQKFEGEQSGEIAQGVGAAIGGLGVEKFEIEELSSKHDIPIYAVLIKQGDVETLTAMRKDLAEAVDKATAIVRRVIDERTKEGDKVLVAGIGNTLRNRAIVEGSNLMTNPSIDIVNLTKTYGSFTAVANLNLKIEGPKCVGFLGPNGAGKTTTLKMLTDLIKPSSGQALINGVNVHTQKKAALASVGTLIETPEIYPSLTPREALNMIAEIRGVPRAERKKRIDEAVAEVRMADWMDKRVGKFSKGMKQRIDIASSLLSDPTILILDEPSSGLDPRGMSEVRDIVKSLKTKKRLIFMSSHILSEVADICDEVAMIDHGKLLVYDTLSNVTAKFAGDQNSVLVGLIRPIDGALVTSTIARIAGVTSAEKVDETNLRIKFSGGLDVQQSILSNLVKMDIGVITYKPSASALEDTYLNLITATL